MSADLEVDFNLNPTFIAMVRDDATAHVIWCALCTITWYKIRTVTSSEDDQVVEMLSADLSDPSKQWCCSSRYAGEMIADMRSDHHDLDDDYINWAFRGHVDVIPEVFAAFRAIGWIPVE